MVPLPDIKTRIEYIKMKIKEADFQDQLRAQDFQKIGVETKLFSFRDLQRLW